MVNFRQRPFLPARWAPGPHAQTLLARLLRSGEGPAYARERVETPDGDFLDLDWTPDPAPGAPLVLLVHGLEGSARRRYVRNVARELLARGVRAVAMNLRGCSGEPNRQPRFYHSGDTGDSRFVLQRLRERHPDRRVGVFGFSLGGNVLLKLLGEDPLDGSRLVDAAVAMSVPYDLAAGAALLERSTMGRAYIAYFLRSLRRKVRAKRALLDPHVDVDDALSARTIREFDERVTAPLNGFSGADHYYAESSSARFVEAVRVPTLLLHAEDDPFLPPGCVPVGPAGANPHVSLMLHAKGGHVGFLQGSPRRPSFWADEEGVRFLAETLRR